MPTGTPRSARKAPVKGTSTASETSTFDAFWEAETSASSEASVSSQQLPEAQMPAAMQAAYGNSVVHAALSGMDMGGLGPMVQANVTLGTAGADAGAVGATLGGQAMLRQMLRRQQGDAGSDALGKVSTTGGRPLDKETRARMEAAFDGHDFSHVRIHDDPMAAQAAEEISAHAFAVGEHIFLGAGEGKPGTPQGDRLLAHELTHVVQHDEGRLGPSTGGEEGGMSVSSPTDPAEQEAYANEDRVLGALSDLDAAPAGPAAAPASATETSSGGESAHAPSAPAISRRATVGGHSSGAGRAPKADLGFGEALMGIGENLAGLLGELGLDGAGSLNLGDLLGQAASAVPDPDGGLAADALGVALQGQGGPLPYRAEMEARFGVDLGNVRCVFGEAAAQACQMVGAEAFAVGNTLVFAMESPSADLVAHELTHVIQQGGHLSASTPSVPSALPVSAPGDAAEREADHMAAGGPGAEMAPGEAQAPTGVQMSRRVDVSGTQTEVLSAIVQGVLPAGGSAQMETFRGVGDGIQSGYDAVRGTLNGASAFPLHDASSLFDMDSYDFVTPRSFSESLQQSGDTTVETMVESTLAVCETALSVLDNIVGTIQDIIGVIRQVVDLLEKVGKTLNLIAKVLFAIAAALASTGFGSGLAKVLIKIGKTCNNTADTINNIAEAVNGFVEPLEEMIAQIEEMAEKVRQVAEVCAVLKGSLDVYRWLTADTATDRAAVAQDILSNVTAVDTFMDLFDANVFDGFASHFWNDSQPQLEGALENELEVLSDDGGGEGGLDAAEVGDAGMDEVALGEDAPGGPEEAVGESADEAAQVYEEIKAEESDGEEQSEDEGSDVDGAALAREGVEDGAGDIQSGEVLGGDPELPAAQGDGGHDLSHLNIDAESVIGDDTGIAFDPNPLAMAASVLEAAAFEPAMGSLSDDGYPTSAAEIFDYLNNMLREKEVVAALVAEGDQAMFEADALEANAEQAIIAMSDVKAVSEQQEATAEFDGEQQAEGMDFMVWLQELSQDLQADLQERIDEAMGAESGTNAAGTGAMGESDASTDVGMGGSDAAGGAMGIIKKVSTAVLKGLIDKVLEKFSVEEMIKNLIPGDLQEIYDLVMNFVDMAQDSKDKAAEEEAQAADAEAVLGEALAMDEEAAAVAQENQAHAEQMIQLAEETRDAAVSAREEAQAQQDAAWELDASIDAEVDNVEGGLQERVSEAGPLREREAPPTLEAPGGWDGLEGDLVGQAEADGGTTPVVDGPESLGVSDERGFQPDPLEGPDFAIRETEAGDHPEIAGMGGEAVEGPQGAEAPDAEAAAQGAAQEAGAQQAIAGGQGAEGQGAEGGAAEAGAAGGEQGAAGVGLPEAPVAGEGELVAERLLEADLAEAEAAAEHSRHDPAPPPAAELQEQELREPVVAGLDAQAREHTEVLQEVADSVPDTGGLYGTLQPLPEPATLTEDARPQAMDPSGLGLGEAEVIVDADVAAFSGWAQSQPTDVKLLDPPSTAATEPPPMEAREVAPVPDLPVAQLPATPTVDVGPAMAVHVPVEAVEPEDAERVAAAADLMHYEPVAEAHAEAMAEASQIAAAHEAEQAVLQDNLSSGMDAIREVQNQETNAVWGERDAAIADARQAWAAQRDATVSEVQGEAQGLQTEAVTGAGQEIEGGRSDADAQLRQAEAQAEATADRAASDAVSTREQAVSKAAALWGWFKNQVARFAADLAGVLSGLWSRAHSLITDGLIAAQGAAMDLLSSARDAAMQRLGSAGEALASAFVGARDRLVSLAGDVGERIRGALDAAIERVVAVAEMALENARALVDQIQAGMEALAERTREALGGAWSEFDEVVDDVRQAEATFDGSLENAPDPEGVQGETSGDADAEQAAAQGPDGAQGAHSDAGPEGDGGAGAEAADQAGRDAGATSSDLQGEAVPAFLDATPTERAHSWPDLGGELDAEVNAELDSFQGELPTYHASLVGEAAADHAVEVGAPGQADFSPTSGGDTPTADLPEIPQLAPFTGNAAAASGVGGLSEDSTFTQRAGQVAGSLNTVETSDGEVPTSPGPVPAIPLEGEADPARLQEDAQQAAESVGQAAEEAAQAVLDSPGPEIVQPLEMDEPFEVEALDNLAVPDSVTVDDMERYLDFGLPGDVEGAFDDIWGDQMRSTLQPFHDDVQSAEQDMLQGRELELEQAEAEARSLSEEAQAEQEALVAEQREVIHEERQRTLDAQHEAVAEFHAEMQAEYDASMAEVDARIQADQAQVNDAWRQAERDAAAEIERGEQQAVEEKRRAEQEAENQSWWSRAANFVRSAVQALTDAISSIFDAVRSAVTAVFDAVVSLANTIIDAAVSFAVAVYEAYGELLKAGIQLLLGSVFPDLADALCDLVDSVVDFVTAQLETLGDMLKERMADLVNFVRDALMGLLDLFQGALEVALATAQALLTGDWMELVLKAMEAALRVAGISPDEFYAFVGNAEETLEQILESPGDFISNCIAAVRTGFDQFSDNFLDHLQSGFLEWVTGETGLEMPEQFNAAGIFDLTLQVLGISYDSLREKAVEHLGEERVDRLEFVWGFIDSAIQGGLEGLWEHVQENLNGLYETIVDGIQDWLVTQVIKKAVVKIASMFNPVGALVQAILTAWELYNFLKTQIQRIWGVVQAVVSSISDIVRGNFTAAANLIEGALSSLVPVAIDLLARLLGLGGLGAKIREIIQQVQDWVSNAIDALIETVKGWFPEGEEDEAQAASA